MTYPRQLTLMASALLVGAFVVSGCAGTAGSGPAPATSAGAGTGARSAGGGFAVAGYLVPWDPRSRVPAARGAVTEVSPVWFQPTETGAVAYASDQARSSAAPIAAEATARGVPLAPSISNFRHGRWDGALVAALISDPVRRSGHIAAIVNLVRTQHWPAIDIDYESLPARSRGAFSAFVAQLANALHRVSAQLSVTVHAKTSEPGTWSGAQAQDWRAIGAAADEVRVMAYDYSQAESDPGPIAPSSWVSDVLRLASKLVPVERIALGVPTYGYDWPSGAHGVPVQWADATTLARDHGTTPRWDPVSASPWLRYTDDQGREHTIWYENARSLSAKLDLAKRYGVTRIVLWRLGGEDPAIWPALRAQR